MKTKALVLLNMGGARSKNELRTFLKNMFNDENILTIKSKIIRSIIASLIVIFRINKAWKNYEAINKTTPLYKLTDSLTKQLQIYLPDFFIVYTMRYTSPFAKTTIAKIKEQNIKDIILLPLYAHYSTTTTKSSLDNFLQFAKNDFNIKIIKPFYKNDLYNQAICNDIAKTKGKIKDFHLIFSAHGLPQKIIDKGDSYQQQIQEHIEILKTKLSYQRIFFKSINLAYQSKVGFAKWLSPSLEKTLQNFRNEKVLIYPISFIIDNSETVFELDIEYRHLAKKLQIKEYKVCKCLNDNELFLKALSKLI